jgi:hypothetical protein
MHYGVNAADSVHLVVPLYAMPLAGGGPVHVTWFLAGSTAPLGALK